MNGRDAAPDVERAHALMMAALDGEATAEERGELEGMLVRHPELGPEWERLRRVKEVTTEMTLRQPPQEVWDSYWASVYRRTERGLAWMLVSFGAAILIGWGAWHAALALMADPDLPLVIKAAVFALALGGAILVVSLVREKLFVRRRDPYKEVVR